MIPLVLARPASSPWKEIVGSLFPSHRSPQHSKRRPPTDMDSVSVVDLTASPTADDPPVEDDDEDVMEDEWMSCDRLLEEIQQVCASDPSWVYSVHSPL